MQQARREALEEREARWREEARPPVLHKADQKGPQMRPHRRLAGGARQRQHQRQHGVQLRVREALAQQALQQVQGEQRGGGAQAARGGGRLRGVDGLG